MKGDPRLAYHGDPGFLHTPFNPAAYMKSIFIICAQAKIPLRRGLEIGLGWGASATAFLLCAAPATLVSFEPNATLEAIGELRLAFPGRFFWAKPGPGMKMFGTFDWIYIDGSHKYEDVRQDIRDYEPLLAAGGILAFDDYANADCPDVKKAVDDAGIPVTVIEDSPTGQAYWVKQ